METQLEESDAISLSEQKISSLLEGNLDAFSSLFDEKGLIFFPNGTVETKSALMEGLKSKKTVFQKIELKKAMARLYDGTAVVYGEGLFNTILKGEEMSEILNFIDVWVKREADWKLVSSHFIKAV